MFHDMMILPSGLVGFSTAGKVEELQTSDATKLIDKSSKVAFWTTTVNSVLGLTLFKLLMSAYPLLADRNDDPIDVVEDVTMTEAPVIVSPSRAFVIFNVKLQDIDKVTGMTALQLS